MRLVLVGLAALAASACASTATTEEREALLAEPIDCAVAEADIATLEAAKPSGRERRQSALRTVVPVGAITSVATGSYRDRAAVLIGRTTGELEQRIVDIEEACGIDRADVAIAESDEG